VLGFRDVEERRCVCVCEREREREKHGAKQGRKNFFPCLQRTSKGRR